MFGVTDWVIMDTGSLTGIIPTDYIRRYHLPVIATSERGSDGFTRNMHSDFVIIPEIRLGHTVLYNQFFTVAPVSEPVLGLLQLGQLRHLSIDTHTLRFGLQAPFDCHDTLRAASVIAGVEFRLLFSYRRNGQENTATLDTGDNSPAVLSIRTKAIPTKLQADLKLKKLITAAGHTAYRTVITPATISFTHFTADDDLKYIQSPMDDTLIPSGILRLARFSMDMKDHVVCLTPYGSRNNTDSLE